MQTAPNDPIQTVFFLLLAAMLMKMHIPDMVITDTGLAMSKDALRGVLQSEFSNVMKVVLFLLGD